MLTRGRETDLFKQLESCMAKCDNLSLEIKQIKKEHKKEIKNLKKDFQKEKDMLNSRIQTLEKENKQLREENTKLHNEVDRLKSQINNDSNNSSLPPSSDIKPNKKDIPNNREKSSNKPGGQINHKGYSLSKASVESGIKSGKYNHIMKDIGNVNNNYISKYVLDIKICTTAIEYRIHADEHGNFVVPKTLRTDVQYGNELKTVASFLNVNCNLAFNKVAEFINSITHNVISLAPASIVNFVKTLNDNSANILKQIENSILNSTVMNTDNTTSRCNGKNVIVRNHSANDFTLLKVSNGKSRKYIEETGILTKYTGNLVHDHETLMYNYGNKHAECNVHVCRYLKGCFQDTNNSWSKDFRNFLLCLNEHKKELIKKGIHSISKAKLQRLFNRYDELLELGFKQNLVTKNNFFKLDEKRLLNRLKKYKSNHLMFLESFDMPFDNNVSERDLRHIKSKQKVSGGFRSERGLNMYCNIKSILITCTKKKIDIFTTINNIYENIPVTL